MFQYAVKVVCGSSDGRVVAGGEYWTAINIHDPRPSTPDERPVQFEWKVAIALPGLQAGGVTPLVAVNPGLKGDEALEIDREDIFRRAEEVEFEGPFIKGFVVIQSRIELDVVAVYTASGATGAVETMHTERVSPRRLG